MAVPVKSTFKRPAAQRKVGWRAWNRYCLGLILSALWVYFYTLPTIRTQWDVILNLPAAPPVMNMAELDALPKESWGEFDHYSSETLRTMRSGQFCFKWEPGCDESQMNGTPSFAQSTAHYQPHHWYALRFFCVGWVALMLTLCVITHRTIGLVRTPSWVEDSALIPLLSLTMLGAFAFYVYSYWGREEPILPPDASMIVPFTTPLLLIFLPAWLMSAKEYLLEHPAYRGLLVLGKGGAARFGGIYSFIKFDFSHWPRGASRSEAPIFAGLTPWSDDPKIGGRRIGLDSDSMMLTVASMGGGKSLYAAWNTLLAWPGGAFVIDPKGEHAQRCYQARRKHNTRAVHVLDPWGEVRHLTESACFNPLEGIDISHPNALDEINQIVLANIVKEGAETGNSVHFRQNGQKVMRGVIVHVLSKFPLSQHNLPAIYDTFLMGTPDGISANPEAFKSLIADMAVNEALGKAPMDAAKVLLEAGDNERGSFVTTLATGLSWVNNPALRPILQRSTFSMKDLKQKRASVFLVIPFEQMREHSRFVRTVVSMGLIGCREEAAHRHKTLFLLDEFPQLGSFIPIKEGLVTLRSREVKIWMMVQNLGQLREHYENFSDFMASCDKQFFAIEDYEDAEMISKLLGEYTERWQEGEGAYRENRKPLRSPTEVREELRKGSGVQYVLPTNGLPLKLKLVPFTKNFSKSAYGPVRGNRFDQ
ncbi:MAG: type IV secretory system conjugative DNA transfer family protein [Alphaproteobacteria bacterium]|nr:type IV secretory system conjugative DNA transfer family protein [Alphaproteobacteria bacterium]MBP7759748.1 type IV secretory system conjugative DNA transfer family protein [Alphaproteobacteria bacterium]MBP7904469.1 type IV secretory system conjugative DNA transfer family protein [Alphaproteobacteria bacterium]